MAIVIVNVSVAIALAVIMVAVVCVSNGVSCSGSSSYANGSSDDMSSVSPFQSHRGARPGPPLAGRPGHHHRNS